MHYFWQHYIWLLISFWESSYVFPTWACYQMNFFFSIILKNLLEGGGTGNNLQDLLGDRGLTGTVVFSAQPLGKVSSVVTRGLHGLHTSSKLGGDRLLERAEDLAVEVEGEDGVDDLDGVLLEDHVVGEILGLRNLELGALNLEVASGGCELKDLVTLLGDLRGREGDESSGAGGGGNEGDELGVKKLDGIGLATEVGVEELLRDGEGLLGVRVLASLEGLADGESATLEVGDALLSDEHHVACNALILELIETGLCLLDHEGVVAATETTVTGDDDKGNLADLALGEEG
mmetsp:Transcript_24466/g.49573  ORF Transcript_24466/g.49573 Transcript_24466/m.49573 type:complete len:290 (+) Transcript_24466:118-987(+)